MIGINCDNDQRDAVDEFFQLFKIPWEYCQAHVDYDLVISTKTDNKGIKTRYLIIFNSRSTGVDKVAGIKIAETKDKDIIRYGCHKFPVYGRSATFIKNGAPLLFNDENKITAVAVTCDNYHLLRVGFDLFEEVKHLLSKGQCLRWAGIPTLDYQIEVVRALILSAGLPLVEILPKPYGFKYIGCMTHDVDFMTLREHLKSRSFAGFVVRALFPFLCRATRNTFEIKRYLKNIKAVIGTPAMALGLTKDPWDQIETYVRIEKGIPSTFYFIPYEKKAGLNPGERYNSKQHSYRAARYDVRKHSEKIKYLQRHGKEIGLHGLDSWYSADIGKLELETIKTTTSSDVKGIRMHWLYFDEKAPEQIEKAGCSYDSTLGYNDSIGYFSGTTQVFRLPGAENLLELPLNVQDTALFTNGRMALHEAEAMTMCMELLDKHRYLGGVFTLNWHQRSLGPERNWGEFYQKLLEELKADGIWFSTASDAVEWFRKRRSARFLAVDEQDQHTRLIVDNSTGHLPALAVRQFQGIPERRCGVLRSRRKYTYKDYLVDDDTGELLDPQGTEADA